MTKDLSNQLIDQAAQSADQAIGAAHRGVAALRQGTQQLADRAQHAGDATVTYIRDEPVKAMLIAATAGAVLMALVGLLTRSSHRH
jgi:ElaB/YqjD/DUF883 family membrane-anchored ribosome-binding protein